LLRWDGSQWVTLETYEIYRTAHTLTLTERPILLAICYSGLKKVTNAAPPIMTAAAPPPVISEVMPVEEKHLNELAVIIGVLLVIGIVVVLYLQKKGNPGNWIFLLF